MFLACRVQNFLSISVLGFVYSTVELWLSYGDLLTVSVCLVIIQFLDFILVTSVFYGQYINKKDKTDSKQRSQQSKISERAMAAYKHLRGR